MGRPDGRGAGAVLSGGVTRWSRRRRCFERGRKGTGRGGNGRKRLKKNPTLFFFRFLLVEFSSRSLFVYFFNCSAFFFVFHGGGIELQRSKKKKEEKRRERRRRKQEQDALFSLLCRHWVRRGLLRRRPCPLLGEPLGPLLRARLLLGLQDLFRRRQPEALGARPAPRELGGDLLGRRHWRGRDGWGGRGRLPLLRDSGGSDDDLFLDERDAEARRAGPPALELGRGAGSDGGRVLSRNGIGSSCRSCCARDTSGGGGSRSRSCCCCGRRLGGLWESA